MASFQITWINKPGGSQSPTHHIIEVGGANWRLQANDAINNILGNRESYFVSHGGATAYVGATPRNGHYYLHTIPDGTPLDNLLSLTNIAR